MTSSTQPGDRHGRLLVLKLSHSDRHRKVHHACQCDCGAQVVVNGAHLRSGDTRSCGCLRRERNAERRTHGMTGSPTYNSWEAMVRRCTNPKNQRWDDYGGRGITVNPRWLGPAGFAMFLADLGERPEGRTLDRINVDGGYSKENCRWASASVQRRNQRRRAAAGRGLMLAQPAAA